MIARRFLAIAAAVLAMVGLVLVGFVTGSSATVSGAGAATGSQTFTDPVGDSSGAPDITQVAISDIAGTGMIQVAVTVNGMSPGAQGGVPYGSPYVPDGPLAVPETSPVIVWIDADDDWLTGNGGGSDYYLCLSQDEVGSLWWDVARWFDVGGFKEVTQSATMSFSQAGDVYTWTFSKADLGGMTAPGFTLGVSSDAWDASHHTGVDWAPDSSSWSYSFSPASATTTPLPTTTTPALAVKPLIGRPTTTPARAVAGKRFTLAFPVTRSDNGAPLTSGKMVCDPSVQGTVIKHAESFKGGSAKLSFVVPKAAKGKLLKVTVTISANGQSTTRVASFRVG